MVESLPAKRDSGFLLESFRAPREEARAYARSYYSRYPSGGYMTCVDSWKVLDGDVIEFTMRRLPTAD